MFQADYFCFSYFNTSPIPSRSSPIFNVGLFYTGSIFELFRLFCLTVCLLCVEFIVAAICGSIRGSVVKYFLTIVFQLLDLFLLVCLSRFSFLCFCFFFAFCLALFSVKLWLSIELLLRFSFSGVNLSRLCFREIMSIFSNRLLDNDD